MAQDTFVIVTAHNEADRISATLSALRQALPGAPIWVADDGSSDGTVELARSLGADVIAGNGRVGKGAAATRAAQAALTRHGGAKVALLCDGDLGESAGSLAALVEEVQAGRCDLAVAAFARRVGGGLGLALGFARWAIRRRCGLELDAPISGQRAVRAQALGRLLPFAAGFGMEVGMTIAAARAGLTVKEIELDLSHRATGRTPAGFAHRARQLWDFVKVYRATAP